MRKSLYVKLVLSFILVFVLSNVIASLMSYYGSEMNSVDHLEANLVETLELVKEEQLDLGSLEKITRNNYLTLEVLDTVNMYELNELQKKDLENGEIVHLRSDEHQNKDIKAPVAITRIDNQYLIAKPNFDNLGFSTRSLIMSINVRSLIIGSFLFVAVAGFMIRPIKELIEATKRISNKDFDLQLDNKRHDEFGELIESFNAMARELSATEMLRDDFISDVSHEFKTPLTSIKGYTKLLSGASDEEQEEYIDIIVEETDRLSELTNSILLLNRLSHGDSEYEKTQFSLDEQIRRTLVLLEHQWSKKNITINLDLEELEYEGYEVLLSQVWFNLVDNAIKFSNHDSTIDLKLSKHNNQISVSIKDYGLGISKEDQSRIFDKFYKADSSRSEEGNGLGLSIVSNIINIHEGTLEVFSEENKYTEFLIKL